jgi:hypothetical protein
MANSVDLKFDAKRAFGEYFPTVYLDFVEVSYGKEVVEGTTEERYSHNPETGTYINGSFSIYFTREASADQSVEEVSQWVINNLDELYLYSWISGWKTINEKVKNSSLDLRELFYLMEPTTPLTFDSSHPAFETIVGTMKEAFFENLGDTEEGRAFISENNGAPISFDGGVSWHQPGPIDIDKGKSTIDIPGSLAYARFWGSRGHLGPWPLALQSDLEDTNNDGEISVDEIVSQASYMERFLGWTLASYQTHGGGFDINYGQKFSALKLSEYVTFDEETGAPNNIKIEGLYDKDGDEIGVIVNIPVGGDGGFRLTQDTIDKRFDHGEVYLIATIGRKVLSNTLEWTATDDVTSVGILTSEFREMNSTLFNSNFGDITYEHLLTGEGADTGDMVLAMEPEEIYVSIASGSPIDGKPIMSIDGTYHDSTPMNQEIVVNTMNQILNKYGEYIDKNLSMKKNLSGLAYILGDKGENIDLLRRLQIYRKTYMGKSAGTSGKMYEAFKKLLYSADQAVKKQSRLKKILVVSNKIIDSRMSATSVSYVKGHHNGTGNGGEAPEDPTAKETPSCGNYIPEAWAHMSRRTIKTIPIEGRNLLSEFSQYIFEEGLPTYTYEGTDTTAYAAEDEYLGATEEMRGEWVDYYENFYRGRATGAPAEMLRGPVEGFESFTGGSRGDDEYTGTVDWIDQVIDSVVENKGIFFFDYEKALQTQSKLSYVLTPWRIERYFGLHVPYNYFRVKEVRLIRDEMKFKTTMTMDETSDLDDAIDNTVTITQKLVFDETKNYPVGKYSEYSGYIDNNFRYGQPSVMLASSAAFSVEGDDTDITRLSWSTVDPEYIMTSFSNYSGVESGTPYMTPTYDPTGYDTSGRGTTADGTASEAHALEAARYWTLEASAQDVVPTYSYLNFVNFDAPLGMRVNGNVANYNSTPDLTIAQPSGRLQNFHSNRTRGGYRVMAFEYRDYMDDDVAYYNTVGRDEFTSAGPYGGADYGGEIATSGPTKYKIEIDVEDTSLKMIEDLYAYLESDYDKFINNYYNLAIATCSFNNINDQFNDFFANGIKEKYPAYKDREWIRAPYIFNMARNVLFNTFGQETLGAQNTEPMRENAARIARLIGPDVGRLMHLNRFKDDYEKLLNIIKPRVGSPTTTPSGQRKFGAKNDPHPYGDYGSPVYTYHPVYDRTLEVAGFGATNIQNSWNNEGTLNEVWSLAMESVSTYTFKNSSDRGLTHGWPIEEPIYGDMFLSALHEWDYTPVDVSLDYQDMFRFIELIPGLVEQSHFAMFAATSGYRGLYEIPNTTEYGTLRLDFEAGTGGTGILMYPPFHRHEESWDWMTEDIWRSWVQQLIFHAFINKYHRILEDGMGLAPYHLTDRTWNDSGWASLGSVRRFITDMLDDSDSWGIGATEASINAGLDILDDGHYKANNDYGESHTHHMRLIKPTTWSTGGLRAIVDLMNPRIYYTVHPNPYSSTAPDFHRPLIEWTHIKISSVTDTWSKSGWKDGAGTMGSYGTGTGTGTVRLFTAGDDWLSTRASDNYWDYGAIGFVSMVTNAAGNTSTYIVYPGDFAPVRSSS